MKYSANNKPLVCMQTQSTCYKGTSEMTVKGVLWHSTGAKNPNLKRYVQPSDNAKDRAEMLRLLGTNSSKNDWNHIIRNAGLNCWIGKLADGSITTVQTMPWDYKPWGCGSGPKGSCNNGWIQFEICEDDLNNKEYFNKVYAEACEITAYLCEMFNIDPYGTVTVNGVKVPTILCHADSYDLGLGSNHGDIDHWFPLHGKSMATVRDDVAKLLNKIDAAANACTSLYRVRKTWVNAASQIGAYADLKNAKVACDKAGEEYFVFNAEGKIVYPIITPKDEFIVGDKVQLLSGAKYTSGQNVPAWVIKSELYVRGIKDNGDVIISTQKTGAVTGAVNRKYLTKYEKETPAPSSFVPYLVQITADVLNVRAGAGTNYKAVTTVKERQIFTIVNEKNGWGKLKSGIGWISLKYTKKI